MLLLPRLTGTVPMLAIEASSVLRYSQQTAYIIGRALVKSVKKEFAQRDSGCDGTTRQG